VVALQRAELAGLTDPAAQARDYIEQAKADNTRKAYRSDWQDFERWCRSEGVDALPATGEVLALYITYMAASRKVATIQRRLTAISVAHTVAGHALPTGHPAVREVWKGSAVRKGFPRSRRRRPSRGISAA
jgi:hypothetical protein